MHIREIVQSDWKDILVIVKNLRGWFDNVALTFEIPNDLKFHYGLVAETDGKIIGFLTYSSHEGEVYISWLGVDPASQMQGAGKALILTLEDILKKEGIDRLKVETLSETIEYEPYEKTRAFYKKMGFVPAETRTFISKETKEELEMVTLRKSI